MKMKNFKRIDSTILLKFVIFYMLAKTTQSASIDKIDKCPKDYIPDLNGKCVKRFVAPSRKQCQTPNLKFGGFELELGGRIAKFWCEEGWTLATAVPGHIHAMCKLGQWDRPLPTCVRPGCEDIIPPEFGTFVYEMDESIVKFDCPGRQLVGQSVLGCDGQYWNGTEPFCVALTTTTTTTMRPITLVETSSGGSLLKLNVGFVGFLLFVAISLNFYIPVDV